jgi:hypothetical protein
MTAALQALLADLSGLLSTPVVDATGIKACSI